MNLDELDQLVENYLAFRKYSKSANALAVERQEAQNNKELEDREDVISRIMKSLEKCDSLRLLTLWDTYIIQRLDEHPPETVAEARVAEFYVHLYCATYPFRGEVLETANSPNVAARYAARSMTIFKHFLEHRGKRLLKMPEFSGIKNLHKIAFPPTHPSYSYLFRPDWVTKTKERINNFLIDFFKPPKLYTDMLAVQNVGIMEAREVEIKRMFKQREEKFLQFSRSIYDISHDLISTLDEGKTVDKEFLHHFKLKFEEFREVLNPVDAPGGGEGESKLAAAKVGGGEVVRKRRRKKNRDHKNNHAPLITDLSYTVIVQDIQSMVAEVEVELNSLAKQDRRMTSIDAEVALQSAMQASAIFNSLNDFLTVTPADTSGDKAKLRENRRNAALVLLENDVFLLKERKGGDTPGSSSNPSSYPHTIMHAFCASFATLSSFAANMSSDSPKDKTFNTGDISSTYGILYSASCATVYNMCKLFGGMVSCLSVSEFTAQMQRNYGFNADQFFNGLCDAVFHFPVASDHSLENLKILFLAVVAMFSQDDKHKHTMAKKGYMTWLAEQLEECSEHAVTGLFSNNVFILCVLLCSSILESDESRRAVMASGKMVAPCRSIFRVVAKNLVNETDIDDCLHITCLRTMAHLLQNVALRDEVLQEGDALLLPLSTRLQANLSLNPAEEAFELSSSISKLIDKDSGEGKAREEKESEEKEGGRFGSDSVSLAEEFLCDLLLNMPTEANTLDYKNQHPKDSGMKLLINYTKSYIAEHGSLYDETESMGDF